MKYYLPIREIRKFYRFSYFRMGAQAAFGAMISATMRAFAKMARLAARSKSDASDCAIAVASAIVPPPIRVLKKAAPRGQTADFAHAGGGRRRRGLRVPP